MHLNVTMNFADFKAKFEGRKRGLHRAVRKGIIDGTREMYTESRGTMSSLIYNVPIPRRIALRARVKSGKNKGKWRRFRKLKVVALWRRTGTLLRNERFYFEGRGAEMQGIIDNSTPYAQARHDLNRGNKRLGTPARRAPWRSVAVLRAGPRVRKIFNDGIEAELNS